MKSRCVGVAQKKGAEFDKDFEWLCRSELKSGDIASSRRAGGPSGLFCILR